MRIFAENEYGYQDAFKIVSIVREEVNDSKLGKNGFEVGEQDLKGAMKLRRAGQNGFLKFIHVACQIEADQLWWLDVSEYNVVKIFTKDYSKGYFQTDYSELCKIYEENKYEKVEWQTFCDWIERLPYSELITGEGI